MIVGFILVGILLGAAGAVWALLLGTSIWIALLIYTLTGTISVLTLAVCIALTLEARDRAEEAKPYVLAGPQRG